MSHKDKDLLKKNKTLLFFLLENSLKETNVAKKREI